MRRTHALLIMLMLVSIAGAMAEDEGVTYPTAIVITDDGNVLNLTDQLWKTQVYPVLGDREVTSYKWLTTTKKDYVFFDKSLSGLNPFGEDFVEALGHYGNITVANAKKAILSIGNLDSDGDGYSNAVELEMGSLPGDPDDVPEWGNGVMEYVPQYAIVIGLIASVVVVHLVFKKLPS